MSGHGKHICANCKKVIYQCRCFECGGEASYGVCDDCQNLNKPDSKVEVKECPFCGRKAEIFHNNKTNLYTVECYDENEESCDMEPSTSGFEKEQDAIEAWNTRSPIANNGVSVDDIDKALEDADQFKVGRPNYWEEIKYKIIPTPEIRRYFANAIHAKLQPTAPRGGNMFDVVKKAVESGAVVIKRCTLCKDGKTTVIKNNRGYSANCPFCKKGFTITEGEVS